MTAKRDAERDAGNQSMHFAILGPLHVRAGRRVLPLGSRRQRAVLASLMLRADQRVDRDEIINVVWGERQPQRVINVVQSYISRLRRIFGAHAGDDQRLLESDHGGYALHLGTHEFDLRSFRRGVVLAGEAQHVGDQNAAWQRFSAALRLWRGEPAADLDPEVRDRLRVGPLASERTTTLLSLADAGLALGRYRELAAMLEAEAGRDPFNEPLHACLMRAYAALGMQAEALRVFTAMRSRLSVELGLDPSPVLAEAHRAVLQQRPVPPPSIPRPVPHGREAAPWHPS